MNRRGDRGARVPSFLIISLLGQVYQHMESSGNFNPVTLALLAINIGVHTIPLVFLGFDMSSIHSNCLYPSRIVSAFTNNNGQLQLNRLLLSAFIHADDTHLYYNMLSLYWKGNNLENLIGSAGFLRLVAYSMLVSHSLVVLLSWALYTLGMGVECGFNSCAVGFSAVIFSLKYVWNQSIHDSQSLVFGVHVPLKYAVGEDTLYTIHYTLYTIHYTLCTIHYAIAFNCCLRRIPDLPKS